jgi:hypothetical protein
MRTLFATLLLVAATPALADETTGTILAFDRQADVIVMTDNTVWQLSPKTLIPADLAAGDTITIIFTNTGENGVGNVTELRKSS